MAKYVNRIKPGEKVRLEDIDTKKDGGLTREQAEAERAVLEVELFELQALLYGAHKNSLLIVLQGRDTGGKDGTIKCLSRGVNIQSFNVASFKVPTEEELGHDFLWRVHRQAPEMGHATVFNRSHYEDVVVVRVHDLVPKEVWKGRFEQINHFEGLLAGSGTIVLKFFLHISKAEQEQRLLDREKDATKFWKLSPGDWKERELWEDYTQAYNDAIEKCSTDNAPWYVVAADHKWFRDLAVLNTVVETLRPYKEIWMKDLEAVGRSAKAEIEKMREGKGK